MGGRCKAAFCGHLCIWQEVLAIAYQERNGGAILHDHPVVTIEMEMGLVELEFLAHREQVVLKGWGVHRNPSKDDLFTAGGGDSKFDRSHRLDGGNTVTCLDDEIHVNVILWDEACLIAYDEVSGPGVDVKEAFRVAHRPRRK